MGWSLWLITILSTVFGNDIFSFKTALNKISGRWDEGALFLVIGRVIQDILRPRRI